jgi:hypothetical protein
MWAEVATRWICGPQRSSIVTTLLLFYLYNITFIRAYEPILLIGDVADGQLSPTTQSSMRSRIHSDLNQSTTKFGCTLHFGLDASSLMLSKSPSETSKQ